MDLHREKIALRIQLGEVSIKFEPRVQKSFEGFGEISLEIPFFRAGLVRVLLPEHEDRITCLAAEIGEWMESHFNTFFSPEFYHKVARQGVLYEYWGFPTDDVDGAIFENRSRLWALSLAWDDIMDGVILAPENADFNVATSYRLLQKGTRISNKLGFAKESWNDMGKSSGPLTRAYLAALAEVFDNLDLSDKGMLTLLNICHRTMRAERWVTENRGLKPALVSETTFRKFRAEASGASLGVEMWYTADYGEPIPEHLARNPVLVNFNGVADRIGGCLNDLFGFMKDVRQGCLDGVIMYRIDRGMDPRKAVEEESAILCEAVRDYLVLRETLVTEEKEIVEYVKMVDSFLHGTLEMFVNSDRYGMKGFMDFVQY